MISNEFMNSYTNNWKLCLCFLLIKPYFCVYIRSHQLWIIIFLFLFNFLKHKEMWGYHGLNESESYHRISVSMKRDNIHTILWCFDRLDNYKCPYIRRVYIGDVWFDPGVWLWDSAGGLTASCLSHLPRECQTVYLTRYALSVFSLSQPWMRTHVYKKIHMHCHATYTYTNIRKTHINTLKCMSL